jgi:hypothetical protein
MLSGSSILMSILVLTLLALAIGFPVYTHLHRGESGWPCFCTSCGTVMPEGNGGNGDATKASMLGSTEAITGVAGWVAGPLLFVILSVILYLLWTVDNLASSVLKRK